MLRLWIIFQGTDKIVCDRCYLLVCLQYTRNLFPEQSKRTLLVSLCNFSPLRTDAINVPRIVWDVLLHKRFPCWCFPVIFLLVHNIMWRCGVPHNMLHLRGLTMSCVTTHPHKQAVMFFITQSSFHWWCKAKTPLHSRTRCYLYILSAKTFETCLLDYKHKAENSIQIQTEANNSCWKSPFVPF